MTTCLPLLYSCYDLPLKVAGTKTKAATRHFQGPRQTRGCRGCQTPGLGILTSAKRHTCCCCFKSHGENRSRAETTRKKGRVWVNATECLAQGIIIVRKCGSTSRPNCFRRSRVVNCWRCAEEAGPRGGKEGGRELRALLLLLPPPLLLLLLVGERKKEQHGGAQGRLLAERAAWRGFMTSNEAATVTGKRGSIYY